ncbi:MAG: hypothetical protein ACTHMI_13405 [Mucilaginibacter sp.]
MKPLNTNLELRPYNKAVQKAFNQILNEAKAMLSKIERRELRCTLFREIKPATRNMPVYEFINPLFYLKLSCENDERFAIHYGFECGNAGHEFSNQTALFTRAIYRFTAKECTEIDIEDCVQTDWVITECSALFEYKEDSANYQFSLLKQEPGVKKRKALKVA